MPASAMFDRENKAGVNFRVHWPGSTSRTGTSSAPTTGTTPGMIDKNELKQALSGFGKTLCLDCMALHLSQVYLVALLSLMI